MSIFAWHGIFSSIIFFISIFFILSLLYEDNKINSNILNKISQSPFFNFVMMPIAGIFVIIVLLWASTALNYVSRNDTYCGHNSEEELNGKIEYYNLKYGANIETEEDFIDFIESQWKIGNNIRNIVYPIIIVFYLIIVFIELNKNKLERKLEKIRESICELSNIPNPDDQTKQILDLLSKTKKKLEKQIQLKSVSKSIKILKQIQADESTVDITREIDELTALYQLNETDLLKEKYQ